MNDAVAKHVLCVADRGPGGRAARARVEVLWAFGLLWWASAVRGAMSRPPDRQQDMKKRKNDTSQRGDSPSRLIDARIKELGDWRGETLSRIRSLIKQADPGVTEEWKWRGVSAWAHDGLICTGETYKNVVKLTFFKGAQLRDPSKLFNSSLEGNARRAIDLHEGRQS